MFDQVTDQPYRGASALRIISLPGRVTAELRVTSDAAPATVLVQLRTSWFGWFGPTIHCEFDGKTVVVAERGNPGVRVSHTGAAVAGEGSFVNTGVVFGQRAPLPESAYTRAEFGAESLKTVNRPRAHLIITIPVGFRYARA